MNTTSINIGAAEASKEAVQKPNVVSRAVGKVGEYAHEAWNQTKELFQNARKPLLVGATIGASFVVGAGKVQSTMNEHSLDKEKKAVGVLVYEAEQRIPKLMKELRALELMYPQTAEAKKSRFERIDAVRQELNALRERFHASRYAPLHDTETTLRNMLSGTESVWNKAYNDIKEQPGFDSVVYLKNAEIDTRLSKN
jgi:hypothetical protein